MPIPKPDPHHDEITDLLRNLGRLGTGMIWSKLPSNPEPDDILAQRDDMEVVVRTVDRLFAAVGEYVNSRTGRKMDLSLFKDQLAGALEGNAYFEIEEAAQDVRDQMEVQNADDRYDAWRDSKMEDA